MIESLSSVWSLLSFYPDCEDELLILSGSANLDYKRYSLGYLLGFLSCLEAKRAIDPDKYMTCLAELQRYGMHHIDGDYSDCE